MLDLVKQLKGFILDGQVVYMHCWGGRGRAGTIASCFLASCYHLSAEETADRIQLAFDTRYDGGRQCSHGGRMVLDSWSCSTDGLEGQIGRIDAPYAPGIQFGRRGGGGGVYQPVPCSGCAELYHVQ